MRQQEKNKGKNIMKKWGVRIGTVLLILVILGFVFKGKIGYALIKSNIAPTQSFANITPPPAPDYSTDTSWAALPQTEDKADFTPEELATNDAPHDAAVFFIHPTTYFSKLGWNAPLGGSEANTRIDDLVMPGQASVFNLCCDIYAPYYRQATLWSYWVLEKSGQDALDLAYGDVERAFDAFLMRIGSRPFVLAGHSQGGHHLETLLINRISGTELRERMIAAYPIGIAINPVTFAEKAPDIPVCTSATQAGCFVTWNSRGEKSDIWNDLHGAVCVNPLSWTTDYTEVKAKQNPGSLAVGEQTRLDTGVTSAQCLEDRLLVGEFQTDIYTGLKLSWGADNFHVLDYGLFYASIRQNAADRVQAYQAKD
ncbi:MAG: hypothetical protein COB56_07710 [Robiginitomaculum sp.]|nr:MAG: hypothetical protein COB56_07710 [Robiginitomaculum sp.]